MLDTRNGYHTVLLSEEGWLATCLITQWGCYAYKVVSKGLTCADDIYNHRDAIITQGIETFKYIIKDTILWGTSGKKEFLHVMEYISRCSQNGIMANILQRNH